MGAAAPLPTSIYPNSDELVEARAEMIVHDAVMEAMEPHWHELGEEEAKLEEVERRSAIWCGPKLLMEEERCAINAS